MMFGRAGSRPAILLLGAAAVAGLIAGTVAVYVRGSGTGNISAADAACAGALKTAAAMAPFAIGEVAAFRIATKAESLADLAFKGPDGADASLGSIPGKAILENFWATWCVPCRAEMPALDRLAGDLAANADFSLVAINVDVRNPDRAKAFLDEIGVSRLAFYSDPTLGVFNSLKRRGLAFGLPTTLVVDGDGCRLGIMEGPAEWDSADAKKLLAAALNPA
jgi:thiol-disulfide isomerase/thioredoxin